MTDRDAIIRSIIENPAEDTPRLVFADWLDENAGEVDCPKCIGTGSHALNPYELANRYGVGTATRILDNAKCGVCSGTGRVSDKRRELAEFIRVQVQVSQLPEEKVGWKFLADESPQRERLQRRERELFGAHDWANPTEWFRLPGWKLMNIYTGDDGSPMLRYEQEGVRLLRPSMRVSVRRGFIEAMDIPWSKWLEQAPAILEANPVRRITTEYVEGLALRILDPSGYNRCWGIAADLPGCVGAWYGMRDRAELLETVAARSIDLALEMIHRRDRNRQEAVA